FTAATVVVPLSALPPELLPSATVTLPVKLGTGFPAGSSAVTWTAGVIAAPATVFDGWTVKASWVAVPAMMSNGVRLAEHTSELQARFEFVFRVLLGHKKKVATPLTAAT